MGSLSLNPADPLTCSSFPGTAAATARGWGHDLRSDPTVTTAAATAVTPSSGSGRRARCCGGPHTDDCCGGGHHPRTCCGRWSGRGARCGGGPCPDDSCCCGRHPGGDEPSGRHLVVTSPAAGWARRDGGRPQIDCFYPARWGKSVAHHGCPHHSLLPWSKTPSRCRQPPRDGQNLPHSMCLLYRLGQGEAESQRIACAFQTWGDCWGASCRSAMTRSWAGT